MNKLVLSLFRRAASTALRLASLSMGAWLVAVLPVEIWADQRRAANLVSGHMPDMDPGIVVAFAEVIAVAPLLAVLLIEAIRCWAMGFKSLALPACVALGASASWPVGCAFTVAWLRFGYPGLFLESSLGILAFYSIRRVWIANREQHQRSRLVR
jgi:hypothetical protein